MTYKDLIEFEKKFREDKEAFFRGEYKEAKEDKMSPECEADWIRKCNS